MANVQLAVAGDETTQVILSVPGVQGPAGSNLPPSGTTHQLLYKQSNTNYDTAWKLITNDNVDAAAAIAGTKISPNFGSQNVLTTGTSTAASFIPTSSGVPTNGLYLPSANNVALSTNGTGRLFVDATGKVTVNQTTDGVPSINIESDNDGRSRTILRFTDTDVATAANQPLGVIQFFGSDTSGAGAGIKSTIGAYSESANGDSYLTFSTATSTLNNQERLRITSAGLVGIGTISPGHRFHVVSADTTTAGFFQLTDTTTTLGNSFNTIHRTGNDGDNRYSLSAWQVQNASGLTQRAFIGARAVTGAANYNPLMVFGTTTGNGTYDTRMVIDGSGRVGIGTTSPTQRLQVTDGTLSNFYIAPGYDGGAGTTIGVGGGEYLAFSAAPFSTERARIDSSGRLLIGTFSDLSAGYGSLAQIYGTGAGASLTVRRGSANTGDGSINFIKTRGSSAEIVSSGDDLGTIRFQGGDGINIIPAAAIFAEVDGTPAYASTALVSSQTYRIVTVTSSDWSSIGGPNPASVGNVFTATGPSVTSLGTAILNAGNMPGRLVFSTTADGSVSPTERMRINSAGLVGIGTSSPIVDLDVAPAASTATFRIHARSNTTPVAAIELVRGTNTTFGADGNGDYRIKNDTGNLSFEYGDSGTTTERLRITSAGLVGIGTNSPDVDFHVSNADTARIRLENRDTTGSVTQSVGVIEFEGNDGGTGAAGVRANINAVYEGVDGATALAFGTAADGASVSEKVRIDRNGRVGVGTTSPNDALQINKNATNAANAGLTFKSADSNESLLSIGVSTSLSKACITSSQSGTGSALPLVFAVGSSSTDERMRIDSSGRLLVGTSTLRAVEPNGGSASGATLTTHFEGISSIPASVGLIHNGTTAAEGSALYLARTRGTAVASSTLVALGDTLGTIAFAGGDGTDIRTKAAEIYAVVDGTPGANDMPGRLVFSTTAGGASSPTERFRITNDGVQAYNQPAPAAVNATATLTVANLKAGIITSTSAAATDMTLPTGTDTEAGFSGIYTNFTFEWSVINTGPSLVRVLAGTAHTIVGSGSVATGTSGRFASRRTAANTFVTYRLS